MITPKDFYSMGHSVFQLRPPLSLRDALGTFTWKWNAAFPSLNLSCFAHMKHYVLWIAHVLSYKQIFFCVSLGLWTREVLMISRVTSSGIQSITFLPLKIIAAVNWKSPQSDYTPKLWCHQKKLASFNKQTSFAQVIHGWVCCIHEHQGEDPSEVGFIFHFLK